MPVFSKLNQQLEVSNTGLAQLDYWRTDLNGFPIDTGQHSAVRQEIEPLGDPLSGSDPMLDYFDYSFL